jgi:hypothetical protein
MNIFKLYRFLIEVQRGEIVQLQVCCSVTFIFRKSKSEPAPTNTASIVAAVRKRGRGTTALLDANREDSGKPEIQYIQP